MSSLSPNLRGIVFMLVATFTFVTNDTFLKLATEGLPPFEVLFLRGVFASLWGVPLVLMTGNARNIGFIVNPWVLLRNVLELFAVLCFIVALANMPIADISSINLTSPMLIVLGAAAIYGERVGLGRGVLVMGGFIGGLLVAQPSAAGVSPYALLGFGCAILAAGRDLVGRRVPKEIPAVVVAYSILLCVAVGAGIATLIFEDWVAPAPRHLLLLAGSGLFLTMGHFFLFLSYRLGATGVVAPFAYAIAIWAVASQAIVFGSLPNALALSGIGLILACGVGIALLDERKRRLLITA